MMKIHWTTSGEGGNSRPVPGGGGLAVGVLLLATVLACPAADLFNDGFEGYPEGQTFLSLLDGWQASTDAVQVQTNAVAEGVKAVMITSGGQLSNTVSAAGATRIWTDQQVNPPLGAAPIEGPGTSESLRLFFNSAGYVGVYHDGGWDICSNDVNGVAVPPVTGGWVRVSLFHDFDATNTAVLLRGQVLRAQVPFVNAGVAAYSQIRYANLNDGSGVHVTNAYVDAVQISTDLPAAIMTGPDTDNDGMVDAQEIDLYGNTTHYHRPVITVTNSVAGISGQDPGTVTPSSVFDVFPGASTNFAISANPAFVVADILTNKVSVGSFTGQGTRNGSFLYSTITADTTLTVVFTYHATRYVPADYAAIGAAVAAALPDETIFVADGAYSVNAPIVVGVPMTLTGNTHTPGSVVLHAPATGDDRDIFQVRSDNVTIQGFRMTGAQNSTAPNAGWVNAAIMAGNDAGNSLMAVGGTIEGLTNACFRDNEYTGCSFGVYLHEAVTAPCFGSRLSGNGTGVWATALVDWRHNWWGNLTGPSGAGPGSGDAVSANVLYSPWWSDAVGSHLVRHVTLGGSLQNELDEALDGDCLLVDAGTYTGDVAISNNLTLLGGNFTLHGDITLATGVTLKLSSSVTASNLTVAAGQAIVFDGADMTVTGLTVNAGGTLTVSNGTLVAGGVTLTGTFTLDDTWGLNLVAQPLPFSDGFELYGAGQRLDRLGPFGWGASSPDVVVQTSPAREGLQSVRMAEGTALSNSIHTTSTRVWTDIRVIPPLGLAPQDVPASGESVRLYFTTNGYVAVATLGGWDVCSQDAFGNTVPPVSNAWVRISLHHNFDAEKVAVFLDGRLLREAVPFLGEGVSGYHRLRFRNTSGAQLAEAGAYVDAVSVRIDLPTDLNDLTDANGNGDLAHDGDLDGMADAEEIHLYGNLSTFNPIRGSVFRFL